VLSLGYPVVLFAGLIAAIVRRRRLGPAAGPAIAGFAILVGPYAGDLVWAKVAGPSSSRDRLESRAELPGLAEIPVDLLVVDAMMVVANAVGLLLLVAAVVRGRSRPEVLVHDEEVAGRGE
jgi:hypothetical protein